MPYYDVEGTVLAAVPRRQRLYVCYLCGVRAKLVPMLEHLKVGHKRPWKKLQTGGYVIYEEA